jgi:hypothetical protein
MAHAHINIQAGETEGRKGFSLNLQFSLSMGECFESITHHAVFETKAQAECFAAKVQAKLRSEPYKGVTVILDLAHWVWTPSKASYDGRLQVAPTAVRKFIPATKF